MTVNCGSMDFIGKVKDKCADFKVTNTDTVIFEAMILDEVILGNLRERAGEGWGEREREKERRREGERCKERLRASTQPWDMLSF